MRQALALLSRNLLPTCPKPVLTGLLQGMDDARSIHGLSCQTWQRERRDASMVGTKYIQGEMVGLWKPYRSSSASIPDPFVTIPLHQISR